MIKLLNLPYNEIGHFLLVLSAGFAFVQIIAPCVGLKFNRRDIYQMSTLASQLHMISISLSFFALMHAFIVSDFSMVIVVNNSHSLKPLLYKIAGTWGNHEGSLLLWVLVLSIMGGAISIWGNKTTQADINLHFRTLSVQGIISLSFICFMLFSSNPFDRIFPPPLEGLGLNPLLQDIGLVLHPPLLYIGYVGLSVAFSYAISSLINGDNSTLWIKRVRIWVLLAWSSLSGGIILGSWWAYYELGWGGFWFWDPVENASLMPWLICTALLHSVIIAEKLDNLKAWTALLAILAFSFSLLGTFIVRSGIITSVHAFASDPERGLWILAILTFTIGGGLFLYAIRAPLLKRNPVFKPLSREGAIVMNNVLLSTIAGVVLIGTLYPVILESIIGIKISVGAPYFEQTVLPMFIVILGLLCIVPFLHWKNDNMTRQAKNIIMCCGGFLIIISLLFAYFTIVSLGVVIGLALALCVIITSLIDLKKSSEEHKFNSKNSNIIMAWFKIPLAKWAMQSAHIGIAIFAIGAVGASTLSVEKTVYMQVGDSVKIDNFTATFVAIKNINAGNYTAHRGEVLIKNNSTSFRLLPENRVYISNNGKTTEASIEGTMWYDIYITMGQQNKFGEMVFKIYKKPFAPLLWWGGILIVIGGLLASVAVVKRNKQNEKI